MPELLALLEARGEMSFTDFVAAARAEGLRPEMWLNAKHRGLLHTWLDTDGNVRIAAGAAEGVNV